MSSAYITDTLTYQDLEKIEYSQGIRENPSDYSQIVNDRVGTIVDESFNYKRAAFEKAHTDLARYMDMEHNANNFKTRNRDVVKLQDEMNRSNSSVLNLFVSDMDNSKRQFEINEYYYYNKLETLFFLQLFFIATLVMAMIVYGQKKGMIGNQISGIITLVLLVIVVVTGLYRYMYTKKTRDTRLWHRRRFDEPTLQQIPSVAKCDANGNIVVDLDAMLPAGSTKCGLSVKQNLTNQAKALAATANTQIIGYLNTGQAPTPYKVSDGGIFSGCGA